MDSFHKPSALSFDGNTSENWRRFKQQFDIYVTASGSEKKDDTVKIAILLNFAGEDAIEVFNTFQFAEGDEKKLNKVLEQFEQYCNPRKDVVFETSVLADNTERFWNRGSARHSFEKQGEILRVPVAGWWHGARQVRV